jgi:hypothetical protein
MAFKRTKQGKVAKAAENIPAPSPNAFTNLILADIALRAGGALLRRSVEKGLLSTRMSTRKARRIVKGRNLTQSLVGTALARVATRSVPGAIVVGGGLLAKTLYDRRRGAKAKADGQEAVARLEAKGKDEE